MLLELQNGLNYEAQFSTVSGNHNTWVCTQFSCYSTRPCLGNALDDEVGTKSACFHIKCIKQAFFIYTFYMILCRTNPWGLIVSIVSISCSPTSDHTPVQYLPLLHSTGYSSAAEVGRDKRQAYYWQRRSWKHVRNGIYHFDVSWVSRNSRCSPKPDLPSIRDSQQ